MEMCILQRSSPVSFAERMSFLKKRPATPRCLFGPPDPAENQRLYQEEMQRERERFQRKYNIDLDLLEEAIEKSSVLKPAEEPRIPPLPKELEERLTTTTAKEEKTSRSLPGVVVERKCKKPCSKFQKRVRVGGMKKQTHLTDFWRSRRSVFVFGKSKARTVTACLQEVQDLLLEQSALAPGRD